MAVVETVMALGSWSIRLRDSTPKSLLDSLTYLGHIAVVPGKVNVGMLGDSLLTTARYVGVFRARFNQADGIELKGTGTAFWLGDEDDKGDVFETAVTTSSATFANAVRAVLPPGGSIVEGTLYTAPGTFSNKVQYDTPRKAIQYITDTFSASAANPVEWRVNGNFTLDAGPIQNLYPSTLAPTALLIRKPDAGKQMRYTGVSGELSLDEDTEDYTTKVILLGEGESSAITVGTASGPGTTLKDGRGNTVKLTRVVSESTTAGSNVNSRAQTILGDFISRRQAAQLNTGDYDVKGAFGPGDTILVYDVDAGFYDANNEIFWDGQPINPMKLRVSELNWPIPNGWTVAFRDSNGAWFDLSDYYAGEDDANTNIVVGEFLQRLGGGVPAEVLGDRAVGDASIPGVPVFGTATTYSYQTSGTGTGDTRAQILINWSAPLNTDGSTIVDGDHYEVRWRPTTGTADWTYQNVPWGTLQCLVIELLPGTSYAFQIRAVDCATPPNAGAWSGTSTVTSQADTVAPSQPAAPTVAASLIAVQVSHTMGKASGGTYNIEPDMDHFEVHAGASSGFAPDATTRLGKLMANVGNIRAGIPAVGNFDIASTSAVWVKLVAIDQAGNRSTASPAASATAILIDDSHIGSLTASKITAGTISSSVLLSGTIATAASGARVQLTGSGLQAYNTSSVQTVDISGATGAATITGKFRSGFPGTGVPYLEIDSSATDRTTVFLYNAANTNYAFMNSPQSASGAPQLGLNSGEVTALSNTSRRRLYLYDSGITLGAYKVSGGASLGTQLTITDTLGDISVLNSSGNRVGGQFYADTIHAEMTNWNSSSVMTGGRAYVDSTKIYLQALNAGSTSAEIALENNETITIRGRFAANSYSSGTSAVVTGFYAPGAGVVSGAISYGLTMATTPHQVFSLSQASSPGASWKSAQSTTGVTFNWPTASNVEIDYWGPRHI